MATNATVTPITRQNAQQAAKETKRTRPRGADVTLKPDSIIRIKMATNPKRPNTDAWHRTQFVLDTAGKTKELTYAALCLAWMQKRQAADTPADLRKALNGASPKGEVEWGLVPERNQLELVEAAEVAPAKPAPAKAPRKGKKPPVAKVAATK